VFELQSGRPERVERVSANVPGGYSDGVWRAAGKPDAPAIIVTTTFSESLGSEFSACGDVMDLTVLTSGPEGGGRENDEFVFVIDCSGSMSRSGIERARECLDLFLRSLPIGSFLNVVRFGSSFEKRSRQPVEYNEETT